jgi:hypothetical protein
MEEQAIKEQAVQATRRKPFSVCTLIKESNQCKNKYGIRAHEKSYFSCHTLILGI